MNEFYILHYTQEIGSKEYIVITDAKPTRKAKDEYKTSGYTLDRVYECEADQVINRLPTDRSLSPD